jgi:hypothetical protein
VYDAGKWSIPGPDVTLVEVPVAVVFVPEATNVLAIGQLGISPSLSILRTQRAESPVPKESVSPATIYPPSEVSWMELA